MSGEPEPSGVLAAGVVLPDLDLSDQHGQRLCWSELWQDRHALLVFYPFAFSPTCTRELDGLDADVDAFAAHGVQVVGISCDPVPALRAFSDARGYRLPLLSDFWPHGAAARTAGVFDGVLGTARRGSLLVGTGGRVRWSLQGAATGRPHTAHRAALDVLSS